MAAVFLLGIEGPGMIGGGTCKSRDTNSISSEPLAGGPRAAAPRQGGLMQVADKKLDGGTGPRSDMCYVLMRCFHEQLDSRSYASQEAREKGEGGKKKKENNEAVPSDRFALSQKNSATLALPRDEVKFSFPD